MKRTFLFLAIAIGLGTPGAVTHSQDAEPEAVQPTPAPAPIPPIPKGPPIEMLKAIRDANAKILEQQTSTLQKLEEMEKLSQTLKALGKRS